MNLLPPLDFPYRGPLTHWGRVTHICVGKLTVNGTLRNKRQWKLNRNLYTFIQENAFENVVWKTAAILSRPQCVDVIVINAVAYLDLWFLQIGMDHDIFQGSFLHAPNQWDAPLHCNVVSHWTYTKWSVIFPSKTRRSYTLLRHKIIMDWWIFRH